MDRTQIVDHKKLVALLEAAWTGSSRPLTTILGRPTRPLRHHAGFPAARTEHPMWELLQWMPLSDHPDLFTGLPAVEQIASLDWPALRPCNRGTLAFTYCWPIISPGDLDWMVTMLDGRSVVDIGAGTGYIAWQLAQLGVDVLAYDIAPKGNHWAAPVQYHPVLEGGPEKVSGQSQRALLLSWPPYATDMAFRALSTYEGDTVIYIGESEGGCTADDDFFALLDKEWSFVGASPHHVGYDCIHCSLRVFRRS